MDASKIYEEKLREATCFGDEDAVHALVEKGLNINAQHEINGWTALHWAAKRGHANIVAYLLSHGADKTIHSKKGETPAMLTDSEEILRLLGASPTPVKKANCPLPITPGYLKYPSVNYKVDVDSRSQSLVKPVPCMNGVNESQSRHEDELVLKVRIAQANDPDFIEVELPFYDMSYSRLLRVCCEELGIDLKHVLKIRKLPDTIIRKDKDVRRLQNLQELELVLSTNRVNNGPTAISSPGFRNCTILY